MSERWFTSLFASLTRDQAEAVMRGYVTGPQLQVYLAIFDHVNRSTGEAWPSKRRLAEMTNLSRATVTRAIQSLEELGWIYSEVRVRDSDKGQTSNLYRLAVENAPPPGSGVTPPRLTCEPPPRLTREPPGTVNQLNQEPRNQKPPTPQSGEPGVQTSSSKKTPRQSGTNPRALGTSPRQAGTNPRVAAKAEAELTADRIWSLIPSSDRALAPAGTDRLREALADLLARPPRRTTREQLVGAFRDRLAKRLGLGGVSDVRGLLRSAAREVDHDEAAAWIAERLRVVRVDQATPDEPPADQLERVDVTAHLERVAKSAAPPRKNRHEKAPQRPATRRKPPRRPTTPANAHGAPERPEKETA